MKHVADGAGFDVPLVAEEVGAAEVWLAEREVDEAPGLGFEQAWGTVSQCTVVEWGGGGSGLEIEHGGGDCLKLSLFR